jgi:hypothetical protein
VTNTIDLLIELAYLDSQDYNERLERYRRKMGGDLTPGEEEGTGLAGKAQETPGGPVAVQSDPPPAPDPLSEKRQQVFRASIEGSEDTLDRILAVLAILGRADPADAPASNDPSPPAELATATTRSVEEAVNPKDEMFAELLQRYGREEKTRKQLLAVLEERSYLITPDNPGDGRYRVKYDKGDEITFRYAANNEDVLRLDFELEDTAVSVDAWTAPDRASAFRVCIESLAVNYSSYMGPNRSGPDRFKSRRSIFTFKAGDCFEFYDPFGNKTMRVSFAHNGEAYIVISTLDLQGDIMQQIHIHYAGLESDEPENAEGTEGNEAESATEAEVSDKSEEVPRNEDATKSD